MSTRRIAGAVCIVLAAASALEAGTFRVAFITDPVGPRALPWLACALLALGGVLLMLRAGSEPDWPQATMRVRLLSAVAGFIAYTLLLAPLGFVLATTLLMAGLARLFDGRAVPALIGGAAFSLALWLLFVQALGVPLPIGLLFARG